MNRDMEERRDEVEGGKHALFANKRVSNFIDT